MHSGVVTGEENLSHQSLYKNKMKIGYLKKKEMDIYIPIDYNQFDDPYHLSKICTIGSVYMIINGKGSQKLS